MSLLNKTVRDNSMNEQELILRIEDVVVEIATSCPQRAIAICRELQRKLKTEHDSKYNRNIIHQIKELRDLKKLINESPYLNDTIFRVLETGEQLTLPDLEYLYDGQAISIQQI